MREDKIHRIEVHVAGICFKAGKVLIAKRTQERELYPGLWECGGGQVFVGENLEEAIKRQMKKELGVIVEPTKVVGVYEIRTPDLDQKKIPGIKFLCKITGYSEGDEPKIDKNEFTEWKWVSPDRLDGFKFIPGVPEDIQEAYKLLG